MERFDELLEKLNELKLVQKSMDWSDNIPEEIWKKYFDGNFVTVEYELGVDKHRWYETSVSVIKIFNRYLGIRHVTDLFSEGSYVSDINYTIQFFEMKQVQEITYKRV